jgi:hypothetical protein
MNMNYTPKLLELKERLQKPNAVYWLLVEISYIPTDELIIEITRHEYTPEYTELTKAFYLKM